MFVFVVDPVVADVKSLALPFSIPLVYGCATAFILF